MRSVWGIALLFGLVGMAQAEVYRWTDAEGKVHFGDKPPAETQVERVALVAAPPVSSPPVATRPEVVMYSAAWCSVCKKARAYFNFHAIPFAEYDVETTDQGRRDYQRLHGNGVPLILVRNQRIDGFNAERFEAAYRP